MAEKPADEVKEASHDINNLSDNEFHNLLEEAFSMTSVKLHDKSPMLQKLLHEFKVDDDLKANAKQKISGTRSALGKKRPERKRCKDDSKSSVASRTSQGGSLQNLSRKLDSGDGRGKNKLQKSGSLSCFTSAVDDKLHVSKFSSASAGAGGNKCANSVEPTFLLNKDVGKLSDMELFRSREFSSHNKIDLNIFDGRANKCNFRINCIKKKDASVTQGNCKVGSADKSDSLPTENSSPGSDRKEEGFLGRDVEEIEMMEIDPSDDEHSTSFQSIRKLSLSGKNTCRTSQNCSYKPAEDRYEVVQNSVLSLKKTHVTIPSEVDKTISMPLGSKFLDKESCHPESFKDSNYVPFQDRSKQEGCTSREYNVESGGDFKRSSSARSHLDVNGNPLADTNTHKTYTLGNLPHCGKKESSDVDSGVGHDKKSKVKRTKGHHTLKEMKAGDISGNIGTLSIEKLVEYINSTDKKGKPPTKSLLSETNNKKPPLKNNKIHLAKMKKNEKENNKRNLPDFELDKIENKEVDLPPLDLKDIMVDYDDKKMSEPNDSDSDIKSDKNARDDGKADDAYLNKMVTSIHLNIQKENSHLQLISSSFMSGKDASPPLDPNDMDDEKQEETSSCVEEAMAEGKQSPEDAEFHIVMKKQRRNRCVSKSNGFMFHNKRISSDVDSFTKDCDLARFRWHYHQREDMILLSHCNQRAVIESRRKSTSSVPPSDHSSVDNSDLDSVHSLPVKSTTVKPIIAKTSSSSSCTPQASYADIARMSASSSVPRNTLMPSLQSKRSVSLTTVENNDSSSLLDSYSHPPPENKRDASTSTSEDCRTISPSIGGRRSSLSHAASYPSLAEASVLSNSTKPESDGGSGSITPLDETFSKKTTASSCCSLRTTTESSIFTPFQEKDDSDLGSNILRSTTTQSPEAKSETDSVTDEKNSLPNNPRPTPCQRCVSQEDSSDCSVASEPKFCKSKSLDDAVLKSLPNNQTGSDLSSSNATDTSSKSPTPVSSDNDKSSEFARDSVQSKGKPRDSKKSQGKLVPAVIIMNKYKPVPNEIEITFGFEINEELLNMSESLSETLEKSEKNKPGNVSANPSVKAQKCSFNLSSTPEKLNMACSGIKFQNGPLPLNSVPNSNREVKTLHKKLEDASSFNYSNVVHYITETWDVILKEFEKEHHLPGDQHQSKIQYYAGE